MRVLLLCISLVLCHLLPAWGAEILVLQSNRSPGYNEALRGFYATAKKSQRTVVLSDFAEIDVQRLVKEERPRVVLAVGDRALASARKLREVPVVAMLALSHSCRRSAPENVGGIAMLAAPEQYLRLIGSMGVRRVGVLYDPAKTGPYVRRIEQEVRAFGLQLLAEPVSDPRDMQEKLDKLKPQVDLLWMLPDSTVFTTVNVEAFMLFSVSNKLPVVTFSNHYLKSGAAASLDLDYFDIGVQAGELAVSLANNGATRRVPTLDPRRTLRHINDNVIRKLGKQVPEP